MIRNIIKVSFLALMASIFSGGAAHAALYWTPTLQNWTLHMDNGVAYIGSPQMPTHCTPARAEIPMSGTEYDRALFAYALSAFKTSKRISVVIDDTQARCIASGINEKD